jgi:hypothetical protein
MRKCRSGNWGWVQNVMQVGGGEHKIANYKKLQKSKFQNM